MLKCRYIKQGIFTMAKSKTTATKSISQQRREASLASSDKAEARPIGQGKDPLAEGNTLVNPTNSEAETHYDVKERSSDVQARSQIAGQDANERAEEHNAQATAQTSDVPNASEADQAEVAAGRVEPDAAPEADVTEEPDPLAEQANEKAA
jgi:hypothetical protein